MPERECNRLQRLNAHRIGRPITCKRSRTRAHRGRSLHTDNGRLAPKRPFKTMGVYRRVGWNPNLGARSAERGKCAESGHSLGRELIAGVDAKASPLPARKSGVHAHASHYLFAKVCPASCCTAATAPRNRSRCFGRELPEFLWRDGADGGGPSIARRC